VQENKGLVRSNLSERSWLGVWATLLLSASHALSTESSSSGESLELLSSISILEIAVVASILEHSSSSETSWASDALAILRPFVSNPLPALETSEIERTLQIGLISAGIGSTPGSQIPQLCTDSVRSLAISVVSRPERAYSSAAAAMQSILSGTKGGKPRMDLDWDACVASYSALIKAAALDVNRSDDVTRIEAAANLLLVCSNVRIGPNTTGISSVLRLLSSVSKGDLSRLAGLGKVLFSFARSNKRSFAAAAGLLTATERQLLQALMQASKAGSNVGTRHGVTQSRKQQAAAGGGGATSPKSKATTPARPEQGELGQGIPLPMPSNKRGARGRKPRGSKPPKTGPNSLSGSLGIAPPTGRRGKRPT